MRLAIAALLLFSTAAHAQAPRGPDPRIHECTKISQTYTVWAIDLRRLLERNSSDRGGRVDQSFISDVNFALVSAGEFVHTNIKFVQQAEFRGDEPSVRACRAVTAMARNQIEQYVGQLLSEVHPSDRWGRESLRESFCVGLQESTRRFQGY